MMSNSTSTTRPISNSTCLSDGASLSGFDHQRHPSQIPTSESVHSVIGLTNRHRLEQNYHHGETIPFGHEHWVCPEMRMMQEEQHQSKPMVTVHAKMTAHNEANEALPEGAGLPPLPYVPEEQWQHQTTENSVPISHSVVPISQDEIKVCPPPPPPPVSTMPNSFSSGKIDFKSFHFEMFILYFLSMIMKDCERNCTGGMIYLI